MTTLVAGVDCSTQSTKVTVCEAHTGEVVHEGRAPHPDATEVDPAVWGRALAEASKGLLDEVAAISVAGQQHGMVALDADRQVVRPALLWNDTRSAAAAEDLVSEFGGPKAWADAVGSVPVASFTVSKLRWLAAEEPESARRVESVVLPHDWLTWQLAGASGGPTTDRGDASGTGYWSPARRRYRDDLLRMAFGRDLAKPRVAAPAEPVAHAPSGTVIAAGTGDNMGAALGLGAGPGDVVVSLGTSGTVFAVSDVPTADASGQVAGFADATGRHLPLVCTLNAARVLTAAARLLDVDLAELDRLALGAEPGAAGLTMLPYLDGERVPNLPDATGSLRGMTRANLTPANLARAAVEGMLCGLADGVDAIRDQGVPVERVLLIGGAAQSQAVRQVAAGLFDAPVEAPRPAEYVAIGAARQAAWAWSGEENPPEWPVESAPLTPAPDAAANGCQTRAAYAHARDRLLSETADSQL
ncbi:MAG: xylulokinase [Stackebrandtia sp.]